MAAPARPSGGLALRGGVVGGGEMLLDQGNVRIHIRSPNPAAGQPLHVQR